MKSTKQFPFKRARHPTAKDVSRARRAIAAHTGKPRRKRAGRPPKASGLKYVPISIRLHPEALRWLKAEAKRRAMPYQSIINEVVMQRAG